MKNERFSFYSSCGSDLGIVRKTLVQPDTAGNSIALAREEIARAVAARIQTGEWWHLGAMVPEVEKLFESPQERRLRLLRKEEAARLPGDPEQGPASLSGGILAGPPSPTARPSFLPSSVTDQTIRHLSSELTNKTNGNGS